MLYWDNAATTWPKPVVVRDSVRKALELYGANPGRAGHKMSVLTAERVFRCREKVSDFFGLGNLTGVVFTHNCTTSLNIVIQGILGESGRALITDLEHNAVMRPLAALSAYSPRYDVVHWCADEEELITRFRRAIRSDTKMILCMHASNVFGVTLPIRRLGELAHQHGLLFCVDAAQTAGVLPIHMVEDHIDYLCVAPHKGLYAPMGTGLLLCREQERLSPLLHGGTGSQSLSLDQPSELPERLECGTPNVSGICGISAGLNFIQQKGINRIYAHEIALLQRVYDLLCDHPNICFYTERPQMGASASVLSLNIEGVPSETVASLLDERGIAVRAGLHCAPSAHRHFGTLEYGTIRLAPSAFSRAEEADYICKVFLQIAEKTLHSKNNMV